MLTQTPNRHEHAVVAGGGSGIGLAVVRRLMTRGVPVTVLDLNPPDLDAPAHLLEVRRVDVTDEGAVDQCFTQIEQIMGPLTRLVVSVGAHGQLMDTININLEDWQDLVNVHLRANLVLAQAFGRRVLAEREDGSREDVALVTLGSTTGITASRKQGDYGPLKAAAAQLTRVLAMEWASSGVRANAVAPGMTLTPFVADMVKHGYDLSLSEQRTPLGRLAEVDEVAVAIEFLLMDATYITGVVLPVDGGWTALGR